MTINDHMGGPAFPVTQNHHLAAELEWTAGMTLWDYYAAAALAGAASDAEMQGGHARWAAEQADAMLAERAKRIKQNEGNGRC